MSAGEVISPRELLVAAEEEVSRAWAAAQDESFDTAAHAVLDRIAQIGVVLVERRQYEDLELVADTLARLFRGAGPQRPPSPLVVPLAEPRHAMRWYDIAARAYLIGAVGVQAKAYAAVRPLVLQQPNEQRAGRLWLRDTVTALARVKRFEKRSLLVPIPDYAAERPVFFRRFRNSKDELVNCLCRFDLLQCVLSVAEAEDIAACYPNFGIYNKERTEPIIVDLITGGRSREAIPTVSDEQLAAILIELDRLAAREFFDFAGWSASHWDDPRVATFLKEHGGQ